MRLLSFVTVAQPDAERVGAMLDDDVIDLCAAQRALGGTPTLPRSMKKLLGLGGAGLLAQVKEKRGGLPAGVVLKQSAVRFLPPVTNAGKFLCVGKPNAAELFLRPGDVVECAIEGVMTLTTRIVAPA